MSGIDPSENSFFPWKIFFRVVGLQTILVVAGLAISGGAARYFFERQFTGQVVRQLRDTLRSVAVDLRPAVAPGWCSSHATGTELRFTLIRGDGSVACDSHHDPSKMENHGTRPEVLEARRQGFSESLRFSATIQESLLYGAYLVPGSDWVLRAAIPIQDLQHTLKVFDTSLVLILFAVAIILIGIGVWQGGRAILPMKLVLQQARNLTESFQRLPPGKPSYGEWAQLEDSIEKVRLDLQLKIEQQAKTMAELKRAEQMRIDFVANVSHELRTPLTSIKGYADTLALDLHAGKKPELEFINALIRNTDRLMTLVNDLLDLSALDSGEEVHKSAVSTEEVTVRVIEQMRQRFEEKKLRVEVRFDAREVSADVSRLEQVLVNLLDNARKYSPEGGRIFISWVLGSKGQAPSVILEIRDEGPGIPTEHHSRLFERFYRVDKSRSRELGGTGLGLAIVKHIMLRHGGSVWVESTPGHGASFFCRFPAT